MKFLTIVIIAIGLIVLFNAAGIETASGGLAKQFLYGGLSTFRTSSFWKRFVTILTIGVAGTAVAGLFGRSPPESYLVAGLLVAFGGLILTDMLAIYTKLWELSDNWMRWIVTAIFIPLLIGFFLSMISYWRGSDG